MLEIKKNIMKTGVKVGDAMTREPIFARPNDDIRKCAKIMAREHIGSLIIKENKKLVGLVTEQDIVRKTLAKGKDPLKMKISDIMVKKIVSIDPDKDIYDALVIMRDKNIRQIPVMHQGNLVGLLTLKDILKIEPQLFDLLVEKFEIRESGRKPIKRKPYIEGECENCSNYAQLYYINDQWLCEECKDQIKK